MSDNDGWPWHGRQQHQWFGHGAKPKDEAALPGLAERITACRARSARAPDPFYRTRAPCPVA